MEAGDTASLTGMNYPFGAAKLGIPEVERKMIKPIGAGANKVLIFNQGYRYKEFVYTQYMQTDKWLKEAIAVATGAIPASHLFHFEIPVGNGTMDYFDLMGVVLQKYELELSPDDFPKETLTFIYYDIRDSVAVTNCPNFNSAQPVTHADASLTVDSDAIIPNTMKLTIDNTLLDVKGGSKYQRLDPLMKGREVTVEIDSFEEASAQGLKPLAIYGTLTAINLITFVLTIGAPVAAAEALTITNMYVDTNNVGELPEERDLVPTKMTLKMGGDCSITSA